MSQGQIPPPGSPPPLPRLFPLHPSLLPQVGSPYSFHGAPPMYQPIAQATGVKRPLDLAKRRVSEARRQRTPMSCDRCKIRKIKCIDPTPGPCGYCSRMKFHCQITAQRKHRPLYFTSDEQFQWMIAILQHFVPDINLELDGLKALGAQLGVVGPSPPPPTQTPMRSLPPSLEKAYEQTGESTSNPSEYMSGRSESPTSDVEGEIKQQINENVASPPNAEISHPSSPSMTHQTLQIVPSQTTSPDGHFSSKSFGALPDRAKADLYVQKYFSGINDIIWVISYDEFMSWYQDYEPNKLLDLTKRTILSLICAFGANGERNDERDAYCADAERSIGSILQQSGLEAIQSLVSMYEPRRCGVWTFTGSAIRVAQCMNILQDNELGKQEDQGTRRRLWWTLYDLERFFSATLSLPSSIIDESVNISLPADDMTRQQWIDTKQINGALSAPPPGYTECSISLSQALGRTATYISQPTISLYNLLFYFGELQEWLDTLPEPFRPGHSPILHSKHNNFLILRWRDAVMTAMKPFLASLARFGSQPLPYNLRVFFQHCAHTAAIAARDTLALLKSMKQEEALHGITAFYRHFLQQSAVVLALSVVAQQGSKDKLTCYTDCVDLITQFPEAIDEHLVHEMRILGVKLERFAETRLSMSMIDTGFSNSPMPSLSFKQLLSQFNSSGTTIEDNLARWIPRRVIWEDVSECIMVGLKREGITE